MAGSTPLVSQVGIAHRVWLELLNRTLELETKARDRDAKLDMLRYQLQELEALKLQREELDRARRGAARGSPTAGAWPKARSSRSGSCTRTTAAARTPRSAARCRRCVRW